MNTILVNFDDESKGVIKELEREGINLEKLIEKLDGAKHKLKKSNTPKDELEGKI